MRTAPSIEIHEPGLVAATWRELTVFQWRGLSNLEQLKRCHDLNVAHVAAQPDRKIVMLTIVSGATMTLPDAAMRAQIAETGAKLEPNKKAEALVIESTGLVAAAVRSIIAGGMLLKRTPFPTRIERSVPEIVSWLAQQLSPVGRRSVSPSELEHAIREITSVPPK